MSKSWKYYPRRKADKPVLEISMKQERHLNQLKSRKMKEQVSTARKLEGSRPLDANKRTRLLTVCCRVHALRFWQLESRTENSDCLPGSVKSLVAAKGPQTEAVIGRSQT